MAVSLTHLGEAIVTRMVNELRGRFLDLCLLRDKAHPAILNSDSPLAYRELPLMRYGEIRFDGASRVDMAMQLSPDLAVPFEMKLGMTRLTKQRVDAEWLGGCNLSHGSKRFSGNMMSILERKFPPSVAAGDLQVKLSEEVSLKLTPEWFLVANDTVLKRWAPPNRPAFSDRVRFLSFESIVDCYGGKDRFNRLVRDMLSFDYYDAWITRDREPTDELCPLT